MHEVRVGAQNSNGWVLYDEQFRLMIAHNPSQDWEIQDNELWLLYTTANSRNPSNIPITSASITIRRQIVTSPIFRTYTAALIAMATIHL